MLLPRIIVSLACVAILAGCNPVANLNAGEDQIAQFHERFNAGEYDLIYREAAPELHEVNDADEFNDILELVELRLGKVESTERADFSVNSTSAGTTTTIIMTTQFAQGEGSETFNFLGHGDDVKLMGYFVNSDRLFFSPDEVRAMTENATEAEPAE